MLKTSVASELQPSAVDTTNECELQPSAVQTTSDFSSTSSHTLESSMGRVDVTLPPDSEDEPSVSNKSISNALSNESTSTLDTRNYECELQPNAVAATTVSSPESRSFMWPSTC